MAAGHVSENDLFTSFFGFKKMLTDLFCIFNDIFILGKRKESIGEC